MPRVVTFGCRLNTYESQIMRTHTQGLDNAIVFNTCAVTAEAERKARQAIRKARRDNPDAYIIVTGCAAQIDPQAFARMPEVDRVLGNQEKLKKESFAPQGVERVFVQDIMAAQETAAHLITDFQGRARAFVEIQNGCNHRCTFCVIPLGRGNSRSVPLGALVQQVQGLVEQQFQEIVLTGVDITSYGEDLPGKPSLGAMVKRLLAQVPQLPRLRLSSIDLVEVDHILFELIATETRLMPHLHLSLQSGDDMILRRMKRRHLRRDVLEFCQRVRTLRPDIVFGADIIAGFPTETDSMFQNTINLIKECDLTYLHIFPYSPRPGTPAARMPQVARAVVQERAARLRCEGKKALDKTLQKFLNNEVAVLMEKETMGRNAHFAPVHFPTPHTPGKLVRAYINDIKNQTLEGRYV